MELFLFQLGVLYTCNKLVLKYFEKYLSMKGYWRGFITRNDRLAHDPLPLACPNPLLTLSGNRHRLLKDEPNPVGLFPDCHIPVSCSWNIDADEPYFLLINRVTGESICSVLSHGIPPCFGTICNINQFLPLLNCTQTLFQQLNTLISFLALNSPNGLFNGFQYLSVVTIFIFISVILPF